MANEEAGRGLSDKEKKAHLLKTFIWLGLISDTFTGKILANIHQGGMTNIEIVRSGHCRCDKTQIIK